MRYIGATNFFIVCPFLLEGIIIGLVSAVITYIMQSYIYNAAVTAVLRMDGGIILEFIEFSEVNIMLFFGFLFAGIFCGICGSGLSSRKYLKA
jgi:cell division transport system permease protein